MPSRFLYSARAPAKITKLTAATVSAGYSKAYRTRRHRLNELLLEVVGRFLPDAVEEYHRHKDLDMKAAVLEQVLEEVDGTSAEDRRQTQDRANVSPAKDSDLTAATPSRVQSSASFSAADSVASGATTPTQHAEARSVDFLDLPPASMEHSQVETFAVPEDSPQDPCLICDCVHNASQECLCLFCGLHSLWDKCPWADAGLTE
ncbi:hypothetical protein Tdes44962_MAKER08142 [Teratosphaeria destructans]|uniref:Uncharacterized protein n=1 Tax=Teratosphaeria destructans TaxID=418781 RepID=A0A9W7W5B8_9PEZI|nr:hypothetical protein Tdes44962_MAKER08142 [Teratosphaeria destructans]